MISVLFLCAAVLTSSAFVNGPKKCEAVKATVQA